MLRRFENLLGLLVVVLLCAVPLTTFGGGVGGAGGGKTPKQQPHKVPKSVPNSAPTISRPTQIAQQTSSDPAKVQAHKTAKATLVQAKKSLSETDLEISNLARQLQIDPSHREASQRQNRLTSLRTQRTTQAATVQRAIVNEEQAMNDLIADVQRQAVNLPMAGAPRGVAAQVQPPSDATASTSNNPPPPIAVRRVAAAEQTTARPTPGNRPRNGGALVSVAEQPPEAAVTRMLRSAPGPMVQANTALPLLAAQGAQAAAAAARRPQVTSGFTAVRQVAVDPARPAGVNSPLQSANRRVGTSNVVPLQRLTPEQQLTKNRQLASGRRVQDGTPWGGTPGTVALDERYDYEFKSTNHLYGRDVEAFETLWTQLGRPGADFEDWVIRAGRDEPVTGKDEFTSLRQRFGAYPSPVTYLDANQSQAHRLRLDNGRIGMESNQPLNRGNRKPVAFVVHPDGTVLVGNYERGKFHHSSLRNGGNVRGAGELYLNGDGTLNSISDKSGHYMPDRLRMLQALDALKTAGVALKGVALIIGVETVGTAEHFLNTEGWRLNPVNQGKIDRITAEDHLRSKPEGTWLLREGGPGQFRDQGVISRVAGGKVVHTTFAQVLVGPAGRQRRFNPDTDGAQLEFVQQALGLQTSSLESVLPSLQVVNAVSTAQ